MNKAYSILFVALFLFIFSSCKDDDKGEACNYEAQAVNTLQYLGSHNSYRIKTYQPIFDMANTLYSTGTLPSDLNPQEWDYDHVSIVEQLSTYNLRTFELDVYYDPDGGRYYNRQGNVLVFESAESGIPELQEPGYKIIHIPDLDYNTHHYTFEDALETMNTWSNQNPDHEPIYIMIELKASAAGDVAPGLGFATALPYTSQAMEDLEAEVKSVFGEGLGKVITPDQLKGSYATIEEAVKNGNWPQLRESRGKFFFILMGNNESITNYTANHPNLEGRAMFYFTDPGNPNCAFVKYDNPLSDLENIQNAVNTGYMVRTRADAGTWEARNGDTSKRDAAFESGAQIISTDYYRPDPRSGNGDGTWTDYHVKFQDNAAFQPSEVNSTHSCPE